jgi:CBS domain-containing protein
MVHHSEQADRVIATGASSEMTNRQMSEIVRRQNPTALRPAATVQEACREMHARRIGAVLVTDEQERLLGIFTGRDAVKVLAEAGDPMQTLLQDVMTRDPDALAPGKTAIEALRLMQDGGFRHVPVVTEAGKLVGVVSRYDFRGLEQDRLDEETGYWERI